MLFLLFVVVASAIGITIVLLRNRRPTSMDASIREFERSLDAIAPEHDPEREAAPRRGELGAGGGRGEGPDGRPSDPGASGRAGAG